MVLYSSKHSGLYPFELYFDTQSIFLVCMVTVLFGGPYYALMTVYVGYILPSYCGVYIVYIIDSHIDFPMIIQYEEPSSDWGQRTNTSVINMVRPSSGYWFHLLQRAACGWVGVFVQLNSQSIGPLGRCFYRVAMSAYVLSPFPVVLFEPSHWPSGHMINSRPLIGQ